MPNWTQGTAPSTGGADLYNRYRPGTQIGGLASPSVTAKAPGTTSPIPQPSNQSPGWVPSGSTAPPGGNITYKGGVPQGSLVPPNLVTKRAGAGGAGVGTGGGGQQPVQRGMGAGYFGGYTVDQLNANPAIAASLGEPAASRWRAYVANQPPPATTVPTPGGGVGGGGGLPDLPGPGTGTTPLTDPAPGGGGGTPVPIPGMPLPPHRNPDGSWGYPGTHSYITPNDPLTGLPRPDSAFPNSEPKPVAGGPPPGAGVLIPEMGSPVPGGGGMGGGMGGGGDQPVIPTPGIDLPLPPTTFSGLHGGTQSLGSRGQYGGVPPQEILAQRLAQLQRRQSRAGGGGGGQSSTNKEVTRHPKK
jgi:hypothetical protein